MTLDDLRNDGTVAMVAFDELRDEIIALVDAVQALSNVVGPECGDLSPLDEAVFESLDAFNAKLAEL